MEASGRNYRKFEAEVSVEFMKVFTTSMEALTTSTEGFILKKHYEENSFRIRQTCENCMKTRRRRFVTNCEI